MEIPDLIARLSRLRDTVIDSGVPPPGMERGRDDRPMEFQVGEFPIDGKKAVTAEIAEITERLSPVTRV